MSKIRLHGTSSGYTDIAPTAAAGNNTLTAPTSTGTLAVITGTGDPRLTLSGSGHPAINLTNTSGSDHTGINFGDSDDINAGMIQYTNSSNAMQFHAGGFERLRIHVGEGTANTGGVSINTTSITTNSSLVVDGQSRHTTANRTDYTIFNDSHHSGSGTLNANRTRAGMRNDVEYSVSSATSNTSGQRLSLFGIHSSTNMTKAAYTSVGGYWYVDNSNDNATNTQTIQGCYGYGRVYGTTPGVNYNIYGGYFLGYRGGNVNQGHCYGIYARAHHTTNGSGKTGDMTGVYSECEFDEESITNAYAFRGHMDRDAGTITNGYILYGSYSGDGSFTNRWGVYINDCAKNKLAGDLTITGTFEKGTDNFRIPHPLVGLSTTKDLVHSVIEGPQMDLIYRGKVNLVDGTATVNIDTKAGMTEGTFCLLYTSPSPRDRQKSRMPSSS